MSNINQFVVAGFVAQDPELKVLDSGKKVLELVVAVNRNYKDSEGKSVADFIPITFWDKHAEKVSQEIKKGNLVNVEARLQTKKTKVKDTNITVIELVGTKTTIHKVNKNQEVQSEVITEEEPATQE